MNNTLVPALAPLGMVVAEAIYRAAAPGDTPYNIANIADFNTLIAQSQTHNTPPFALSDTQIERVGVVLDTMKTSRDNFKIVFNDLARTVANLTGI